MKNMNEEAVGEKVNRQLTRREFLILSGFALSAAACKPLIETLTPTSAPKSTDTPKPPTSTPTKSPTETPTQTPTEDPYRTVTLSREEFASMSDNEVIRVAPPPNIAELGFPPGTQLVPEVVGRWGEGSNYVVYKNPATNDYELAWNPETGAVEHAIYAPAHEVEIAGERCTGIPLLIISDKTILAEDGGGGYFALNQDVVPGTRERIIPDSQARVAEAFCAALGVYHWRTKVGSGDRNHIFDSGLPESRFLDIPGFETMAGELEAICQPRDCWYDKMSGPFRERVVDYMKQRFLLTLNQKRTSGESMNVTLMAHNARAIDLTQQPVAIIRHTHSTAFPPTDQALREIFFDISYTERARTFRWVSQTLDGRLSLTVDGIKRDVMPYLYGGEWPVFSRSFFGKPFDPLPGISPGSIPDPNSSHPEEVKSFSSDITTGYATILSPPELQPPEIQQYNAALYLPAITVGYSCTQPYPGQQSAVNFVTRAQ